jgi:hypothetical protein
LASFLGLVYRILSWGAIGNWSYWTSDQENTGQMSNPRLPMWPLCDQSFRYILDWDNQVRGSIEAEVAWHTGGSVGLLGLWYTTGQQLYR